MNHLSPTSSPPPQSPTNEQNSLVRVRLGRLLMWLLVLPLLLAVGGWWLIGFAQAPLLELLSYSLKIPIRAESIITGWHSGQPQLTIQKLEVGQRGAQGNKGHINVQSATFRLQLLPLLQGSIKFDALVVKHAKIQVVQHGDRWLYIGGIPIDLQTKSTDPNKSLRWLIKQTGVSLENIQVGYRYLDPTKKAQMSRLLVKDQLFGLQINNVSMNGALGFHKGALDAQLQSGFQEFAKAALIDETAQENRLSRGLPAVVKSKQISLVWDLKYPPFKDAGDPKQWEGVFKWQVNWLPLGELSKIVVPAWTATLQRGATGRLSTEGTINFANGFVRMGQSKWRIRNLSVLFHRRPALNLGAIFGNIQFKTDINQYVLDLSSLGLSFGSSDFPLLPILKDGRLVLHHQQSVGANRLNDGWFLQANIGQLHLLPLAKLASFLPIQKWVGTYLQKSNLEGTLQNIKLEWVSNPHGVTKELRMAGRQPMTQHNSAHLELVKPSKSKSSPNTHAVKFQSNFSGLSIAPLTAGLKPFPSVIRKEIKGFPGVRNLSGQFSGNQSRVLLSIDSENGSIDLPGLLNRPRIPFAYLKANVAYEPAGDIHRVKFENVALRNADLGLNAKGVFQIDPKIHPDGHLDLTAQIPRIDVKVVPQYLPLHLENLIHFWSTALTGGVAKNVDFNVFSSLKPFPPKQLKDGRFTIVTNIENGQFLINPTEKPSKGWPSFERINGRAIFDRDKLSLDLTQAKSRRLNINRTTIQIPNVTSSKAVVEVKSASNANIKDVIDYIHNSPLNRLLGTVTRALRVDGQSQLTLGLQLPLHALEKIKVKGVMKLQGPRLQITETIPEIAPMDGAVAFTERGLSSLSMKGNFLGGRVAIRNVTKESAMAFQIDGKLTPEALKQYYVNSSIGDLASYLDGEVPYQATVRFKPKGLLAVQVDSNLQGTSLSFPKPVQKSAEETLPMHFSWEQFGRQKYSWVDPQDGRSEVRYGDLEKIHLQLGSELEAKILQERKNNVVQVINGGYGVGVPAPLADSGILANVKIDQLNIDAWRNVVSEIDKQGQRRLNASIAQQASSSGTSGVAVHDLDLATSGGTTPIPQTDADFERIVQRIEDVNDQVEAPAVASNVSESFKENNAVNLAIASTLIGTDTTKTPPQNADAKGSAAANYLPTAVAVQAGRVRLLDRNIQNVVVGASRTGQNWQANIDSDQINGFVKWEPGALTSKGNQGFSKIEGDFAKLRIPDDEADSLLVGVVEKGLQEDEYEIPGLRIQADQFIFLNRDLGRFDLLAENQLENRQLTWKLKHVKLKNSWGDLLAQGQWSAQVKSNKDRVVQPESSITQLDFSATVHNGGQMFNAFGLKDVFAGGEGNATGSLTWTGSPIRFATQNVDGKIKLTVNDGSFLKFDPGALKLVGLLSVSGLLRNIAIGFKNVSDKGLKINSMDIDSSIQKGVMSIDRMDMDSDLAAAKMQGTIDLNQQSQDLTLRVTPRLDLTVASLGVFAINPILGVGALVAQWLFGETFMKAFRLKFHIGGTFNKPLLDGKPVTEDSELGHASIESNQTDSSVVPTK